MDRPVVTVVLLAVYCHLLLQVAVVVVAMLPQANSLD
jgi:hypothetical protein